MVTQVSLHSPGRTQQTQRSIILVVEDEPDLRDLLCEVLSDEFPSARVVGASCGRQALAMLDAVRPNLLLLDYDYSQADVSMNGIDVYDALHMDSIALPIPTIMISGNVPQEELNVRRIPNLGKPFELDVLLEHVATMLGGVPCVALAGCC